MKRIAYLFQINEKDSGPLQHVKAILNYANVNLSVSSIPLEYNTHVTLLGYSARLVKNIIYQINLVRLLEKNHYKWDIILHRLSVGDFLIAIYAKIKKVEYIVEVNGDFGQDLIDRDASVLKRKLQHIINILNYQFASKIYLVHENLIPVINQFLTTAQVEQKVIVVENGYQPCIIGKVAHRTDDHFIEIGYLGSLSLREGVADLLDIAVQYSSRVRLKIVGGTADEYNRLVEGKDIGDNVHHVPNTKREDALAVLSTCDFLAYLRKPKSKKVGGTLSQGSPLKVLDYILLQKPMILSRIDDNEYFASSGLGIYVDNFVDDLEAGRRPSFYWNQEEADKVLSTRTWEKKIAELNEFMEK